MKHVAKRPELSTVTVCSDGAWVGVTWQRPANHKVEMFPLSYALVLCVLVRPCAGRGKREAVYLKIAANHCTRLKFHEQRLAAIFKKKNSFPREICDINAA